MVHQPQPCRTGRQNKQFARRSPGHTEKTPKRTARNAADGFLRTKFLPLRATCYQELENRRAVEKEFFDSLENLAILYQFEPLAKSNAVYPCNISNAYKHAAQHLVGHYKDTSLAIIKDSTHSATLATYKEYSVGQTLYYIPVYKLWDIMQDKKGAQKSELLQSVFAYLFQIVEIPMYTQQQSYLCYQYEMVYEWYSTDEDIEQQDWEDLKQEFYLMLRAGKSLQRKLSNPCHLVAFENRLKNFIPNNESEAEFRSLAAEFYKLNCDFPNHSVFDYIEAGLDSLETEERVTAYQYLSFIYDLDSTIAHDLFNGINAELQECSIMDNPFAVQLFDKPQNNIDMNLDFPQKLFSLLDDLCDLLKIL
ncbi:hypothetical protein [Dyadobacter sp. CY312]|uniref:hypothetical protein n=1 Tax=Dyadobacter sp. CY312 TaxID=2907303 RepID=UPI001F1D2BD4|nr:hypothetical protein [Dyadobacter sp. CY312]MCE7044437.1 hypothetical protein [Dyadobacter sp. CY312]